MVLTNFECWAHGGSDNLSVGGLIDRRATSVDLFNPTAAAALQQTAGGGDCNELKNVSHLSSNGYYGFVSRNVNNNTSTGTDNITEITRVDSGDDNNDVRCRQEHATSATKNASTINFVAGGVRDDTMDTTTMMDVEQHENVAGAMFLQCAANLPEVAVAAGVVNGFDRRKRFFACDGDLIGMGVETVKRFRHDEGSHWNNASNDQNISLSYFAVHNNNTSQSAAMDHDDMADAVAAPTIPFAESHTVVNYPETNHIHYEHLTQPVTTVQQQQQHHQNDPTNSLNKSNTTRNNTRYIDISRCMTSHMI